MSFPLPADVFGPPTRIIISYIIYLADIVKHFVFLSNNIIYYNKLLRSVVRLLAFVVVDRFQLRPLVSPQKRRQIFGRHRHRQNMDRTVLGVRLSAHNVSRCEGL